MNSTVNDPCVVNKFDTESEAVTHAKSWSKSRREEWTVIHAPTESEGLKFFVVQGDGGMICATERLVGHWKNGKQIDE